MEGTMAELHRIREEMMQEQKGMTPEEKSAYIRRLSYGVLREMKSIPARKPDPGSPYLTAFREKMRREFPG